MVLNFKLQQFAEIQKYEKKQGYLGTGMLTNNCTKMSTAKQRRFPTGSDEFRRVPMSSDKFRRVGKPAADVFDTFAPPMRCPFSIFGTFFGRTRHRP